MLKKIAEKREKLILTQADRYLEDGEAVLQWARAKQVDGRREGFVFLTDRRYIVHWTGRQDGIPGGFRWSDIRGWGVSSDARGGPVLGIEIADGRTCYVQLRAATGAMAADVASFVKQFAELAPKPSAGFTGPEHLGAFKATSSPDVREHKMTVTDHTRRIIITILGVALIVSAILIIPLPGPWSFLVAIGGLAILAREYDWARDALQWTKTKYQQAAAKMKARRQSTS